MTLEQIGLSLLITVCLTGVSMRVGNIIYERWFRSKNDET